MKTVDARGLSCPQPLIMAKKALNDTAIENQFALLIDNETSKENVARFLSDNKVGFSVSQKNDLFTFSVSKTGDIIASDTEEYCTITYTEKTENGHVICIKSERMGSGSDELGAILIQGFINTIKEISPLPKKIIMYNSGVKLAVNNSPVIDALKDLESKGVDILVCGTCADYFNIKETIGAGIISNMYDISESLTRASHVVNP